MRSDSEILQARWRNNHDTTNPSTSNIPSLPVTGTVTSTSSSTSNLNLNDVTVSRCGNYYRDCNLN